ncbi:UDP-N-acetylglucosamine 2-epimerase [uncultured Gemmiger sp.]|uniref:UDP-N-acetylglucosamine 2-epimerase n=1 Tax=uncultured Gemmiger sp. TaxID=1623490 RepID=UPI0025E25A01|nr:UDP-N-acetylglucosamine 2-epimerase [uncultured Gemmiger sp.]
MPNPIVTVVTATRAEYGLLRPVIRRIAAGSKLELRLVVTGAHLCRRLGATVAEIEADGLPIAARLPIFLEEDGEPAARTIARTLTVFDDHFAAHRPDVVLLLGDRFEIFAVAAAAAARHIPIAHISGGDVTLGAADEYYRHCITKMAAVHFPSCADSARRLVRMGEEPGRVFCVGGLGDENIRTLPKMTRQELCESTGFDLMQPFALVTFHPETGAAAPDPAIQVQALCRAMEAVDGVFWLITGSNADAGGQVCTAAMQAFAAAHPDRAGFVQSLGLVRYLSAMQYAALVAGNSSSGVVETPTFGVPAVNIGSRQAGRILCANVLSCPGEAAAIEAAIRAALTPEFAARAKTARSPYFGGDTSGKIVRVLEQLAGGALLAAPKPFYDGPVPEFDPQNIV